MIFIDSVTRCEPCARDTYQSLFYRLKCCYRFCLTKADEVDEVAVERSTSVEEQHAQREVAADVMTHSLPKSSQDQRWILKTASLGPTCCDGDRMSLVSGRTASLKGSPARIACSLLESASLQPHSTGPNN